MTAATAATQNRQVAITLRAVLETPFTAPDPVPWLVATLEPSAWLTLDGTCGDPEVGLFAAVVANYNNIPPGELATAEHLIAPGGLILTDANTTIVPGCCSGLEDWRDWAPRPQRQRTALARPRPDPQDVDRRPHHRLGTPPTAQLSPPRSTPRSRSPRHWPPVLPDVARGRTPSSSHAPLHQDHVRTHAAIRSLWPRVVSSWP